MNNYGGTRTKVLSMLGMARRAGKLQAGFERCEAAVKSGRAALTLACSDISHKTQKELSFVCDKYRVTFISTDLTIAELSDAIGVRAGLAAICDNGFAKRLTSLLTAKREDDLHYDD